VGKIAELSGAKIELNTKVEYVQYDTQTDKIKIGLGENEEVFDFVVFATPQAGKILKMANFKQKEVFKHE